MVILTVREEKDTIILSLMDNGQGMSPEDVEGDEPFHIRI